MIDSSGDGPMINEMFYKMSVSERRPAKKSERENGHIPTPSTSTTLPDVNKNCSGNTDVEP